VAVTRLEFIIILKNSVCLGDEKQNYLIVKDISNIDNIKIYP